MQAAQFVLSLLVVWTLLPLAVALALPPTRAPFAPGLLSRQQIADPRSQARRAE